MQRCANDGCGIRKKTHQNSNMFETQWKRRGPLPSQYPNQACMQYLLCCHDTIQISMTFTRFPIIITSNSMQSLIHIRECANSRFDSIRTKQIAHSVSTRSASVHFSNTLMLRALVSGIPNQLLAKWSMNGCAAKMHVHCEKANCIWRMSLSKVTNQTSWPKFCDDTTN